ncbi:unnamed protein product [Paramecium sonneborni]|uniref:Uncharacterized protein n=1 Tax=Paramecium sonneborni TaxID=65129 RepID=A0A8S1N7X2_9CILI|nr:unnamed protein product [Paramecium sonneborni]
MFKHLNKKTEKQKNQNKIQIDYNDSSRNIGQIQRIYSQLQDVTTETTAFNQNLSCLKLKISILLANKLE